MKRLALLLLSLSCARVYAGELAISAFTKESVGPDFSYVEMHVSASGFEDGMTMTVKMARPDGLVDKRSGLSPVDSTFTFTSPLAGGMHAFYAAVVDSAGETVAETSSSLLVANPHQDERWLDEDSTTLAGTREGTGEWFFEAGEATVANGKIAIDTAMGTLPLKRVVFRTAADPSTCRGYGLTAKVNFKSAMLDVPEAAGGEIFGVSIRQPLLSADDRLRFVVLEGGEWLDVWAGDLEAQTNVDYVISWWVDLSSGKSAYFVRGENNLDRLLHIGTVPVTDFLRKFEFGGEGEITKLRGGAYDADVVRAKVEFDEGSFHPGTNFEATVISGTVTFEGFLNAIDQNGQVIVTIRNREGEVAGVVTNSFSDFYTPVEFSAYIGELTRGDDYTATAEVVFDSHSEANTAIDSTAVMAREVTNETWTAEQGWIRENAATFAGLSVGTGRWSVPEGTSSVVEDQIVINTSDSDSDFENVAFFPTNALPAANGYEMHLKVTFEVANDEMPKSSTTPKFGIALMEDEENAGEYCFAIVTNGLWTVVEPADDEARPQLGVEYEIVIKADLEHNEVSYLFKGEGETMRYIGGWALKEESSLPMSSVTRFSGTGTLRSYQGDAWDTTVLTVQVDFGENSLYPGTNFTATAVNGVLSFTKFWETDYTNGLIRVTLRDVYGDVVGLRRISFHDLEAKDFQLYVGGLTAGETYTAEITIELDDFEIDSDIRETGVMTRIVTNEDWVAQGEWIREDVDTFLTNKFGTGVWKAGTFVTVTNELLEIDTNDTGDSGADNASVSYIVTNALPEHTGYELRFTASFDSPCDGLPEQTGLFGVTLLNDDSSSSGDVYIFAVMSNGVWSTIEQEIFTAETGVEYDFTITVDTIYRTVRYCVQRGAKRSVVLAEFSVDTEGDEEVEDVKDADFYGVGKLRKLEGDGHDRQLVRISVDFDQAGLAPGTNFSQIAAIGGVKITPLWATDKSSGSFTIRARDSRGNIAFEKTISYWELKTQDFWVDIPGLDAGDIYDIEVEAELEGEYVGKDSVRTIMGRLTDGWIEEDADTFAGLKIATGEWLNTNDEQAVVTESATHGRLISINGEEGAQDVEFVPTNTSPAVLFSTLRELHFSVKFDEAGYYFSEDKPTIDDEAIAGIALGGDDTGEEDAFYFSVISNGSWCVIQNRRGKAELDTLYDFNVLIDYKHNYIRYDLIRDGETNQLASVPIDCEVGRTEVGFTGTGALRELRGECWDPNLVISGTNEYADLGIAIHSTTNVLSPLWLSDYLVTDKRGTFKVYDPNSWLNVRFPYWYFVEITEEGDVKIYFFNWSNNWIDYAENTENDLSYDGTNYVVKTPEGLSYIAALATNEWVKGNIILAGDVDLTKHNWTPIALFTGTFDGQGNKIIGLNNSFHNIGIEGGEYMFGPTNDYGRTNYGLFAMGIDSIFRDVSFSNVAISNYADSVAVLSGAIEGDTLITNVTVLSGKIIGGGGTAAGITALANYKTNLWVKACTNRSDVLALSEDGSARQIAGILVAAGVRNLADLDSVVEFVVTNCANYGKIVNTVSATVSSGLAGGNAAQVLAGFSQDAYYGACDKIRLYGNLGAGAHRVYKLEDEWTSKLLDTIPVCNLAGTLFGYDERLSFLSYIDSNVPYDYYDSAFDFEKGLTDVNLHCPVDPYLKTPRMSHLYFANGAENSFGLVRDMVTAVGANSSFKLLDDYYSWEAVVIDRPLTIDFNSHVLFNYSSDGEPIWYLTDKDCSLILKNGTEYYSSDAPEIGCENGEPSSVTFDNMSRQYWEGDFYDHTTISYEGVYVTTMSNGVSQLSAGAKIVITEGEDDKSRVEIDYENREVLLINKETLESTVIATLANFYDFTDAESPEGATAAFEVKFNEEAKPQLASIEMTGEGDGKVKFSVRNTKASLYYALQQKSSFSGAWSTPAATDWRRVEHDGDELTLEVSATDQLSLYRIYTTNLPPQ